MAEPLLSVRSAKARALAHELSQRERRPIHVIVEEALVQYSRFHSHESARQFLERLKASAVDDIDLASIASENRTPHEGIDL